MYICRLARALQYKFVAIVSSHVLIPSGSLSILQQALERNSDEALVMPVMNKAGARHVSSQVLLSVYHKDFCTNSVLYNRKCSREKFQSGDTAGDKDTSASFESYIDDPTHYQSIQHQLSIFHALRDASKMDSGRRSDSGVSRGEHSNNEVNPCVVKTHTRFGVGGAKSMSMSASSGSLLGSSRTGRGGSLTSSNREQSAESRACKEKLLADQRKATQRLELQMLAGGARDRSRLPFLLNSINDVNSRMNGLFFMANVKKLKKIMLDERQLVNSSFTSLNELEKRLMEQLIQHQYSPRICPYAFAHYTAPGDKLTKGEPFSSKTPDIPEFTKQMMHRSRSGLASPPSLSSFLTPSHQTHNPVVIGMAISNIDITPSAGDLFTAKELANSIKITYNVVIKYLRYEDNWYDVDGIDILIVFLDYYELPQVYNRKSDLIQIAWLRNWFHRWLSRPYIGNYDLLLASSSVAVAAIQHHQKISEVALPVQCLQRCPLKLQEIHISRSVVPVDLFRIATNPELFFPLPKEECIISVNSFAADYVFTGSYWDVERDIMQFDPGDPKVKRFSGSVIGQQWEKAIAQGDVNESWSSLLKGDVPYSLLPDIYRATKVVIDDANHVTKPWGSVNSRVFDAVAAGVLVITNGKLGSYDAFHGLLPVYDSPSELVTILAKLLNSDDERLQLVSKLREIVLKFHTYRNRADEFAKYLNDLVGHDFISKLEGSSQNVVHHDAKVGNEVITHDEIQSNKPMICIGVRVYEGQPLTNLKLLLQSLELQREEMAASQLDLSYYIVNTDESTAEYAVKLNEIVDSVNNPYKTRAWVFNGGGGGGRSYRALRGYEELDKLIRHLKTRQECEWIMITNGDNIYSAAWLSEVSIAARSGQTSVIAWDYVSHSARYSNNSDQMMRISLDEKASDLGAMMIRKSLVDHSGAMFLPFSVFTTDLAVRDFRFIMDCVAGLKGIEKRKAISFVHKILMLQQ